jgi:hypothetical protein
MTQLVTKADIFDLFYGKQLVTRAGGGTSKSRMTRKMPTFEEIEAVKSQAKEDPELMKYFVKLRDRSPTFAPPPRPN